jgi:LysR family hydrogen peroxide-inducible transcriptional activator
MNIQQFHYVLAVAELRHFELAAARCYISQSTLSTMISRFESELGIVLFDRKKKPVEITAEGAMVIDQLRVIAADIGQLDELVSEIKGEVKGRLTMSVIPTIAPFLLPLFLQDFAARFPALHIQVREQTTPEILRLIKSRELDLGIVSIPLSDPDIEAIRLYDEPFVYFDALENMAGQVSLSSLRMEHLFLLEEGHCLRTQVLKLCERQQVAGNSRLNFEYKAGSIDSLLRFVKANQAATLLPHLATVGMGEDDLRHVHAFESPAPHRSVGIVYHRHFAKKRVLELLQQAIQQCTEGKLPACHMAGEGISPG